MAGWYKQHTSELARLEVYARCGRVDALLAWLRVTRWMVDNEAEAVPESMHADMAIVAELDLGGTFSVRCAELVKRRKATEEWRQRKRTLPGEISQDITEGHESSQDITEGHETSRDAKREREKERERIEDRKENAAHRGEASVSKKETREQLVARFDAWTPSDDTQEIARKAHFDIEAARPTIRDWLLSTQKPWKGSFDAGVRNWIRRNAPAPSAPRPIVKGWDDGDTWLGIPKGKAHP